LPVLIELRSISAVTDESVGSSAVVIVAVKSENFPRTLLTIMCRTVNETSEWVGSTFHVPAMYPGILTAVLAIALSPR
jgi:hypothetical protein